MTFLKRIVDERFLEFRRRSTSTAGIAAAVLSICLFEYRYFVHHIWSWDLLAVGLMFVLVKVAVMSWHYLNH